MAIDKQQLYINKYRRDKNIKNLKESVENYRKSGNLEEQANNKAKVLEYFNSLNEVDKAAFKQELRRKEARENYATYLKYIYGNNYKLTKFHSFLAKVCETAVKKVEEGKKIKICLSVPPQHGKTTTLTETLPSWFVGRNPELRCIITGYNADMAEKFGDRNREKIKKYGKELFDIEISDSQDNKTLFNLKNHAGGVYSAGITGGITGNQGALIIVDDPYKNGIEAKNQNVRDNVWQIFTDSILTRQRGLGCAIIVIQTRWHKEDLIGKIMETDVNGEWLIINIPCIAEKDDRYLHRKVGETLCPELGFDAKWADNMKRMLGKYTFNAMYQGKPYEEGGNIIKRDDIQFYNDKTIPESFEEIVLSCDLSFGETKKTNDPYCMTLWGRNGGNHYLLKVYSERKTFTETNRTIRIICNEYPQLRKKIIEKKANGNATIELLGTEIGGFVPFDPKGASKEDRLHASSPYFEGHNVFFPDETLEPKIEDYIEQLIKFPNVGHDDFVDTITQYLLNYEYRYSGKIDIDNRFSALSKAIRGF